MNSSKQTKEMKKRQQKFIFFGIFFQKINKCYTKYLISIVFQIQTDPTFHLEQMNSNRIGHLLPKQRTTICG